MSNSFTQLGLLEQEKFRNSGAEDALRDRLEGSLGFLHMIGAVLEVYLPRMADTVVGLTGGDPTPLDQSDDEIRPPLPPARPSGPGEPTNPNDLR